MNARSSSRTSQRSPPIPWSAARGASGSRRRSPKGHRRRADPPCQCHVSTHDERAHACGDRGPRVNGGPRDGLLAIRGQAVTYLRSRLPSRARASTFCVVDQCGYGDNRTAMRRTRHGWRRSHDGRPSCWSGSGAGREISNGRLRLASPSRVSYFSRLETLLKQSDPRLLVTHQVDSRTFLARSRAM